MTKRLLIKKAAILFSLILMAAIAQAQNCRAWALALPFDGPFQDNSVYDFDLTDGSSNLVMDLSGCNASNTFSTFLTGEFVDGKYYMIHNDEGNLYEIDENGSCSLIAPITGAGTGTFTALSHDPVSGITYVMRTTTISSIDLTTGVATQIVTLPGAPISLPIDGQGNAYLIDLNEIVQQIDLSDGSLIGAPVTITGINLNFAQDADFDCDDSTSTLYGTFFDNNSFISKFGTLDPITGVFTEIRDLEDYLTAFSIDNDSCKVIEDLPSFNPFSKLGFLLLMVSLSVVFLIFKIKQ